MLNTFNHNYYPRHYYIVLHNNLKIKINVIVNQNFTECLMFGKPVIPSRFSDDAEDNHMDIH